MGFCHKQMLTMKNSKRCLKELKASEPNPVSGDVNGESKNETK